jgi:hypothetical protein
MIVVSFCTDDRQRDFDGYQLPTAASTMEGRGTVVKNVLLLT